MTPDKLVPLGSTGLHVSEIGLGLAPIGGLYADVDDERARATIDRGWDRGLRLFDTAPLYGYGRSERRTGAALHGRAGHVLATKVGRVLLSGNGDGGQDFWAGVDPTLSPVFDFSAAGIRRSLEDSLRRLGVDRVEIAHLHDPDDHLDQAVREAYPELVRLKEEGLIGAIGAGANSGAVLSHLVEHTDLDVVLLAGRYTLLDRSGAGLLELAQAKGVPVIAAGVFNSGILADPKPGSRFNYSEADPERLNRAMELQVRCEKAGIPLRAAAIQFAARHPAVAAVLVGVRAPEEVDDAVEMAALEIPEALWAELG